MTDTRKQRVNMQLRFVLLQLDKRNSLFLSNAMSYDGCNDAVQPALFGSNFFPLSILFHNSV